MPMSLSSSSPPISRLRSRTRTGVWTRHSSQLRRFSTIVIIQILGRVWLGIISFKHMWLFDQLFLRNSLSNAHSSWFYSFVPSDSVSISARWRWKASIIWSRRYGRADCQYYVSRRTLHVYISTESQSSQTREPNRQETAREANANVSM